MTKNDEKKFAIFMAMLGTAFERGDLSAEKISMYAEFLGDLHIETIERAVKNIIRNRKFPSFPTIAEIREAALGSDVEAEDDALAAWAKANKLVPRLSFFREQSGGAVLDEVVITAFGSWERFGALDPAMEAADRAHFVRCYKAVVRRRRNAPLLNVGEETKRLGQGGRP